MSQLKYCQGTKCHTYNTKDRIKGTKGSKYYGTRRRSSFYYGNGNFCCQTCMYDWINEHIEHALNHFGRITEPKKVYCDNAWYKNCRYVGWENNTSRYNYFLINDLLGKKILISQAQYNDEDITTPNNLSQ
tara:strand:- start:25 stop:417 length:393 start_codon:yes stop_codon:yes gene_type:complete